MANRVSEILASRAVDQRNHFDGAKNSAELGTRGISYPEPMESEWLQRLLWLKDEDWISHIDPKLTNEQQKGDDRFEVATGSEAQVFLGVVAANAID